MRRPKSLSAAFVHSITRPGRYGEGRGGHGLSLRVQPRVGGGVAKSWAQRVRIHGMPNNLGLGTYPVVTLAGAREKALANRRAIAQGQDPRDKPQTVPTFAEAIERVIALHRPAWRRGGREERIWRASFRMHVLPTLGHKPVSNITPADILGVLEPIWIDKQDLAQRLRQRIGIVMDWCVTKGYRLDNPAGNAIGRSLPKRRGPKRHYRALPYADVGKAIHLVRESGTHRTTALCFEFLVLTAARSGEARLARWKEIDFETATWTVPAERMKAGRPHRVPLSQRAIEVLQKAVAYRGDRELVFPSLRSKPLSDATLSKRLRDLGIPAVPHGFRSTFRDWAAEKTDAPRAVMEAALAHKLGDAVEQAYARSDLFEKRRDLMQQWADYLHPPK